MIKQQEKKQISDFFMKDVTPYNDAPILYVIAGSNGAGKSTLREVLFNEKLIPKNALHHEPDAVMTMLEGYKNDVQQDNSPQHLQQAFQKWEEPARELSENILNDAFEQRCDIIYERSCGMETSLAFLKDAKDKGYKIILHLIYVDLETAKTRVENRINTENRYTPTDALETRSDFLQNSWNDYLELSDTAFLYDNTLPNHSFPVVFVKQGNQKHIYKPDIYKLFKTTS